jgi:flavin reductase (DIM6/NTAB) family NADH-FMN oxidoreductase RutF
MKKSLGATPVLYPTPVLVVGSYDAEGRPNAMTAAWGGIACSTPPCISVSLRAATASHGNIVARRAFTISVPNRERAAQADYLGSVSGRDVDKFAVTGLTPSAAEYVDAPYVSEFPLIVECAVTEMHELGLHTQFIGEIKDIKVDDDCLDAEGNVDVRKLDPFVFAPGGTTSQFFALGAPIGQAFSIGKARFGEPSR